ncbi:MAG: hypothetical protein V8Q05_07980 [Lachnospiraceae bacterium]
MESAFQFSNPSLTKMEFCINDDFQNGTGEQAEQIGEHGNTRQKECKKPGKKSVLCVCNRNGGNQGR